MRRRRNKRPKPIRFFECRFILLPLLRQKKRSWIPTSPLRKPTTIKTPTILKTSSGWDDGLLICGAIASPLKFIPKALHPNYAKLYRHRGHRYITVREFDKAIADLEKAAKLIQGVPDEIEPDGAPNQYNIPTSTSHSNIWYHRGLAYYLKGDFKNALRCYLECMKFSQTNDDMLCTTSDWLYMTYRRLGKADEAKKVLEPIQENMKILENFSYHKRLLMYKGLVAPDSLLDTKNATDLDIATQGYGVGNWYLYNGQTERAKEIFERVIKGKYWAAFGYIAAEADLKRRQKR